MAGAGVECTLEHCNTRYASKLAAAAGLGQYSRRQGVLKLVHSKAGRPRVTTELMLLLLRWLAAKACGWHESSLCCCMYG
jgi:hypothetical protein